MTKERTLEDNVTDSHIETEDIEKVNETSRRKDTPSETWKYCTIHHMINDIHNRKFTEVELREAVFER